MGNTPLSTHGISVYPNPAQSNISVSAVFNSGVSGNISISDILGQKVYGSAFTGNAVNTTIDMGALKAGVYMLVITAGEQTYREQIILNK
jgi:hypothetical protein